MARISMLWLLWLLAIYLNPIHELPCQGMATAIAGTVYVIFRTYRTYAIWHQDKRVGALLLLGTVGQATIWCLGEPDRQILPLEPHSDDPI